MFFFLLFSKSCKLFMRIFSFNNPYGACERCSGLGADFVMDPDLVVPDKTKSLADGAIYPWQKTANTYYIDVLKSVCNHYGIDIDKPFEKLSKKEQDIILYGGDDIVTFYVKKFGTKRYHNEYRRFLGVIPYLEKRYNEINGDYWREELERYMKATPCPACGGELCCSTQGGRREGGHRHRRQERRRGRYDRSVKKCRFPSF